jgi:Na+:H+ antiporter, NhaA family
MKSDPTDIPGKPAPTPVERLLLPFHEFMRRETSGGVVLLVCMIVALVWANMPAISPWYFSLWQTPLVIGVGDVALAKPASLWINDGLMALFFFVVGLEIKREVLSGELASVRRAALPAAAAVGGMIVPAIIYIGWNAGSPAAAGWGVPMATDIAFALGVLALLGDRVPLSLKVFLTALAIVDDLGAVLVIAVFFTSEIVWPALLGAAAILLLLIILNRLGVRKPSVYALLGLALWVALLKSGVHATIAGVALAMTIPAGTRIGRKELVQQCRALADEIEPGSMDESRTTDSQRGALQALETSLHQAQSPLQRLEHMLHPWVAFFIMPVFALANAGVFLGADIASRLIHPVTIGIASGLVLGKLIGITFFTWLAVKSGFASLPTGTTWRHITGVAWLGGIGFTMSLFIADLAFGEGPTLQFAKVGILVASFVAGTIGWLTLRRVASIPAARD